RATARAPRRRPPTRSRPMPASTGPAGSTPTTGPISPGPEAWVESSVRVLVLSPAAGLGGLRLRRPLQQEGEVGGDERVGRRHHVGVVDGVVVAREGDPARVLAQPVLELGPDLASPLQEPLRRIVDQLPDHRNLPRLL